MWEWNCCFHYVSWTICDWHRSVHCTDLIILKSITLIWLKFVDPINFFTDDHIPGWFKLIKICWTSSEPVCGVVSGRINLHGYFCKIRNFLPRYVELFTSLGMGIMEGFFITKTLMHPFPLWWQENPNETMGIVGKFYIPCRHIGTIFGGISD